MKKLFVNYDLAVKLKEKGFDEKAFGRYYSVGNPQHIGLFTDMNSNDISGRKNTTLMCNAPLYQQVTDFLREKHSIHIWITPLSLTNYEYYYFIAGGYTFSRNGYKSYYDALEAVIETVLNEIKK